MRFNDDILLIILLIDYNQGPSSIPYLQIHYWGGIQEALQKLGAKVVVTKVPR